MKIVVTGASGYVGSAIVAALGDHEVVEVRRSDGFDIARPETLAPIVAGADAVIHAAIDGGRDAAAIDRRFVEATLEMLRRTSGHRRFVYTSGLWVLGDTGGRVADETTPPTSPARLVAWRPALERTIAEARGVDAWIVRPAIVYGGRGGIIGGMFDALAKTGVVTIAGDGTNHWPLVHRDDLGALFARVVERAPAQRILHATDGSALTVREIATAVAGSPARVVTKPPDSAFTEALALDQRVSSARTRAALEFSPRHRSVVREIENRRDLANGLRGRPSSGDEA